MFLLNFSVPPIALYKASADCTEAAAVGPIPLTLAANLEAAPCAKPKFLAKPTFSFDKVEAAFKPSSYPSFTFPSNFLIAVIAKVIITKGFKAN